MTYNTGAKKKEGYCPKCLIKVEKMVCPQCDSYVSEADALTKEEVRNLKI